MRLYRENDGTDSHVPVVKEILSKYNPDFVLELGIGKFSTPLFIGRDYLGVENNIEWFNYIWDLYPDMKFMYHNVEPIQVSDDPRLLTEEQIADISQFYKSLPIRKHNKSLLFVDQYAALRALSINILRDKFDIIIYHDSECRYYDYDRVDKEGFKVSVYGDKVQTAVMIRK